MMRTTCNGCTDTVVELIKAKADVNAEDEVRVGLAGWMVVSVQRLSTISGVECAGAKVEVSRACCCRSAMPIPFRKPPIQDGENAMSLAHGKECSDIVSVLDQVAYARACNKNNI